MHDIVKEAVNNLDAAWELAKMKKTPEEIVDAVSDLSREETMQLGKNFKRFPIGCDLTEILVGACASDIKKIDLLGNCIVADMLGASIHVCAYAFADIAENYGMRGVDLVKEVRELVDVPLDIDHFGKYGPMRFPSDITRCWGQCYYEGPPFKECPRGRIHKRLLEKEKKGIKERDEWIKLASSVAINLISVQGGEAHAAPLDEAIEVAKLTKKYGRGLEAIMCVGDGYEDLIKAFEAALEIGVDVFVIEGGPFNQAKDRLDAFARAITCARILAPGKVVGTNGAYEDECRIGLRSGLNAIITGFPKNHHGYMCGYSPGTARRGNFGMPRVIKIIKEEVKNGLTRAPIQKDELIALTKSVKVIGKENIYPNKIGYTTVGDAHWVCVSLTPLYEKLHVNKTVDDIVKMAENGLIGEKVALLGGRFIAWVLAKKLDKYVDQILISDADPWVEKITVENLRSEIKADVHRAHSNDKEAYNESDAAIISSTIPGVVRKLTKKLPESVALI